MPPSFAEESLDELAELAGIGSQISKITARAMAGELDFEQALAARLALLKATASLLEEVVKGVTMPPGASTYRDHARPWRRMLSYLWRIYVSDLCYRAKKLGFTGHHANQLGLTDGQLSGTAHPLILGKHAKVIFCIIAIGGYPARPSLCVGDGANDMMMLQEAGLGVTFEGKPALRRY